MLWYALTIFLSAFLLFQVQPLISKAILPWFGGTPAVWTTAMLFFQVLLLGGYAYAHVVATKVPTRRQITVHLVVLAIAALLLPILPGERWKPAGDGAPTWQILLLLSACVGMPYFVLASTSPLMQAWFSRTHPGHSPYRLYALSNVGSLLALLTFPFVFEPRFTLHSMGMAWSVAFGVAALLAAYCAIQLRHAAPAAEDAGRAPDAADADRPPLIRRLLWLALPACGSTMFLAVTNQMCLDVAVVPFFWVLPLSLYLLTFVICFDNERWYFRPVFWAWMIGGVLAILWLMRKGVDADVTIRQLLAFVGLGAWAEGLGDPAVVWTQILGYSMGLFACCMVCHGELVRLKPSPRHLTGFYLLVSAGGALGGVFVSLLAPRVFDTYLELHVGLWATCALAMAAFWLDKRPHRRWPVPWAAALGVTLYFLLAAAVLLFAPFEWLTLGGARPLAAPELLSLWAVAGMLLAGACVFLAPRGPRRWGWLGAAAWFLVLAAALYVAPLGDPRPDPEAPWAWLRAEHILGLWLVGGAIGLAIGQRAWLWTLYLPAFVAALAFLGLSLGHLASDAMGSALSISRNFYGVLKVGKYHEGDPDREQLILSHGRINHGAQLTSEEGRRRPITYFGENSGIGLALLHGACDPEKGMRVGVLGLGTGTIAAYGKKGDVYRFYEINPRVIELSGRKGTDCADPIFTYLTDSEADCACVLGDGRLSLERQPSQQFDLLAMDAFSSDAVPVHLLTREAFDIYRRHIKKDGIIAVNVTNRFVDLEPVVRAQAERLGMKCVLIKGTSDHYRDIYYCTWMLVTASRSFLLHPDVLAHTTRSYEGETDGEEEGRTKRPPILWTDDYSNLFRILK